MSGPALSSETVHATCIAIGGAGKPWRAVLLAGRSGAGKSDLALRLIDRGARLVSDDYTLVRRTQGGLVASAPATISGKMEVRGLGVIDLPSLAEAPVSLLVSLDDPVARMPEEELPRRRIAGIDLPLIALAALEPSAPVKVELAAERFGLPVACP